MADRQGKQSPAASLIKIARSMEKLAEALESNYKRGSSSGRPYSPQVAPMPDYGTLGSVSREAADPLTGFLLS